MIETTLPWPPTGLSPNSRNHWAKTAKLKKQYREACMWQAHADGVRKIQAESLKVHLVFHPPNKRRRDWDNLIASMKSGLDGLSDAIGVDDGKWRLSFEVSDQIGGMVKVTIE